VYSCHTSSAFSATACDSYAVPSGDETYTVSGIYMDTIPNAAGCDSVMSITVTINSSSTGTDIQTVCDSYTWIDSNSYTASTTTATHTLTNAGGCDSVITLNLTLNTTDTSVTDSSASLTANATGATYQWIDCATMLPISGELNQTYTPLANGSHAVAVTQNGCTDTSSCYNTTITGVHENTGKAMLVVYPNPASGIFTLRIAAGKYASGSLMLVIYNVLGEEIYSSPINSDRTEIDLSARPNGVYTLHLLSAQETRMTKLIISK